MSTKTKWIKVVDHRLELVRKDIKNMHLAVYPPNGRVRLAVPEHMGDDSIRLFVISKIGWIKRQQRKFSEQDRQSELQFSSGESHYFRGKRYLLHVVDATHFSLEIQRGKFVMKVPPGTPLETKQNMMENFYRKTLRQDASVLFSKWESELGVHPAAWGIKIMRTRWGTCNTTIKRIWLNLELAKKPPQCLEYIVVHELIHLKERLHNERFHALLDSAVPNWKVLRSMLNKSPLAHEDWEY